jgi:hypothetical protein
MLFISQRRITSERVTKQGRQMPMPEAVASQKFSKSRRVHSAKHYVALRKRECAVFQRQRLPCSH